MWVPFSPSTGLAQPNGLAFDKAGNLYVANTQNGTIEKFTSGGVGSLYANTLSTTDAPARLAFDAAGNLFVADFTGGNIEKITTAGVASIFATAGLVRPNGLAFDSSGNLYASNASPTNTVVKFTPAGVESPFASGGGLNSPTYLQFTSDAGVPLALPFPEPSSFLLAGVGGIALLRRSRRVLKH